MSLGCGKLRPRRRTAPRLQLSPLHLEGSSSPLGLLVLPGSSSGYSNPRPGSTQQLAPLRISHSEALPGLLRALSFSLSFPPEAAPEATAVLDPPPFSSLDRPGLSRKVLREAHLSFFQVVYTRRLYTFSNELKQQQQNLQSLM